MKRESRSKWESKLQVETCSMWILQALTLSKSTSGKKFREQLSDRVKKEFKVEHGASFRIIDQAWRVLKNDFDDERMILLRTMIKELSEIFYKCKEEEKYSYALKALSQMAQIIGLESRNLVKVETTTRELAEVETQVLLKAVSSESSTY